MWSVAVPQTLQILQISGLIKTNTIIKKVSSSRRRRRGNRFRWSSLEYQLLYCGCISKIHFTCRFDLLLYRSLAYIYIFLWLTLSLTLSPPLHINIWRHRYIYKVSEKLLLTTADWLFPMRATHLMRRGEDMVIMPGLFRVMFCGPEDQWYGRPFYQMLGAQEGHVCVWAQKKRRRCYGIVRFICLIYLLYLSVRQFGYLHVR